MAWLTTTLEIGDKVMTASEPSCLAYQRFYEGREKDPTGAVAEFLRSCLVKHQPDVTVEVILEGLTRRGLHEAVTKLMGLSNAEPGKGEAQSP